MGNYFSPEYIAMQVDTFHDAQIKQLGGVDAILSNMAKSWPYTPPPAAFREG